MPSPAARKPRTDVARNRDQVLRNAAALFAERRDETQMDAIRRGRGYAGVATTLASRM